MNLPKLSEIKNWSIEIEKNITSHWKNQNTFEFDKKTKKKIYSIDTPPPYINTPIHMGHAITYSYMDFFARYRRMKGFEVLFPLGLDRNGLPIEMAAEKKYNISPFKIGREKFIEACEKLLEETSTESIDSFARLGISFNSYKEGNNLGDIYKTDSEEYRKNTQKTFINLFRKGLVYEDSRINNWDPKLQTTVSDSEIDYKELPSKFNNIKWKVKETSEEIIIGTTRPELICTCGMVIYNPKDKRYKHLIGKTAVSPIFNLEVPIKEHHFADPEKGTGLVMMCSAGDLTDIQFFREQNLIPKIAINKDGTMNEHAGFLKGLKVKEAREKIIEELKKKNLLERQSDVLHRTPVSERSGAEIEFIEMPEFYLRQMQYLENLRNIINKIDFYPEKAKDILESWVSSVSIDWPISRRRFYATPIPLWIAEKGKEKYYALPPEGNYYVPWKESPPKNSEIFLNGKYIGSIKDFKNLDWKGETRVFDTWFDSSISELNIIGYFSDPEFVKKTYPVTLRPQGKEIVRTWLYYTLLRGYLETEKPAFKEVWIHQHIVDEKGRKMSKSLGNVIDPMEIINSEGSEALRFWSAIEGNLANQDLMCSRERIKAEQKTLNKLLNIAKFILQFKKINKPSKITEADKILIEYMEFITNFCDENYEVYEFNKSALKLRYFLWEVFASHYIELIKARAYNEKGVFTKQESDSAIYTLYFLLERLVILLHPIIPQITSIISKELKLDLSEFPKSKKASENPIIEELIKLNQQIWKEKKERNISLRAEISGIKIPKSLELFKKDLVECHNLR